MRKENNVEKALLNILAKYDFIPKTGLGSCFRRNDNRGNASAYITSNLRYIQKIIKKCGDDGISSTS